VFEKESNTIFLPVVIRTGFEGIKELD